MLELILLRLSLPFQNFLALIFGAINRLDVYTQGAFPSLPITTSFILTVYFSIVTFALAIFNVFSKRKLSLTAIIIESTAITLTSVGLFIAVVLFQSKHNSFNISLSSIRTLGTAIVVNAIASTAILALLSTKIKTSFVDVVALYVKGVIGNCVLIGLALYIFLFIFSDHPCQNYLSIITNQNLQSFNQHIKDSCYLDASTNKCPKNESELRAFNANAYDQIAACANSKYFYNQEVKNYQWQLNSRLIQVNSTTYPQFSKGEVQYNLSN